MKLYLKYGIIYLALVLGINLAFDFSWLTFGNFWLVAAIVCLPAVVVVIIVRLMPRRLYNPENKIFAVRKGENKIFERLNVKKWKEKIPEAGKTGGFARDHIYDPRNPDYIKKYIIEGCIAEALHTLSIIWGFVALFFIPRNLILPMGVPLTLFNFFIHFFPMLIQRYMRPRLLRTLERLTKAQAEKQQKQENQEQLEIEKLQDNASKQNETNQQADTATTQTTQN